MQVHYSIRGYESDEMLGGEAEHTATSCSRWMTEQAARGFHVDVRTANGRRLGKAARAVDGSINLRLDAKAFDAASERDEVARSFASAFWILGTICLVAAASL